MMLVDSHCHLDLICDLEQDNLNNYLQRAQQNNVQHILNVCVNFADFPRVIHIAEQFDFITASAGMHPNEQAPFDKDALLKLAQHKKVVAIGETGLDYYRSTGDLSWQHERFRAHIRVAKMLKKPLIIHTRQAAADTLRIMKEENAAEIGGVMHCFSEDWAVAEAAMEMNFYISFSGVVTFKSATVLQDVAKRMPLERMLVETDAPYLAPVPYRGKTNEPAYVKNTAEYIAALRATTFEEIAEATSNNYFSLFTGAATYV